MPGRVAPAASRAAAAAAKRLDDRVGRGLRARRLDEPVGDAGRALGLAAGEVGRELERAHPDQHARVRRSPRRRRRAAPARSSASSGRPSSTSRPGQSASSVRCLLGEAALLAEGDPLLEVGERAGRPLERVAGDGEVVLQDGGVPARALLDEQGERPLHLGEAIRVAEEGAGEAADGRARAPARAGRASRRAPAPARRRRSPRA